MWKTSLFHLCLALCLLHAAAPTHPEPKYMLLVPTVLHGDHTEKACVVLTNLTEPLTLNVMLELSEQNVSCVHNFVAEKDTEHCWDLQVPAMTSLQVAYVTLHGKGETMEFHGKRSILLEPSDSLMFVQTDKPIYKPEQTVQFRIVTIKDDFRPVHETIPLVYIEDPQRNRVGQWRDVETTGGIAQLSFPLASEPLLGVYKVGVQRSQKSPEEYPFSVEEYVLPKAEVVITMPKTLTILDEEFKMTACAKYTYGKPMPGVLKIRVCRPYRQRYSSCYGKESEAVCEVYSREVDKNGCFHQVVSTKVFQMKRSGYDDVIKVTATIEEEGTGVEIIGEGSSEISSNIGRVSFLHVDPYYMKGLPLHGQVQLVDSAGAPIANEMVFVYGGQDNSNINCTTDQEGKASFAIDTSSYSSLSVHLRVSYKNSQYCGDHNWVSPSYRDDFRTVNYFYSKSNSYVNIHPIYHTLQPDHEEQITVHYILPSECLGEHTEPVFHYLIMAKGGIVRHGKQTVSVPREKQGVAGTITVSLPISNDIAPKAKMLVFVALPNGEVVADAKTFNIDKTFDNKVDLHFSAAQGLPSSPTSLHLEASPGSLCAMRAVDKSVLLMKPEAELSVDSVYDLLPVKDLTGYNHGGRFLEEANTEPCIKADPIFLNGLYYNPSSFSSEGDTYDIMKIMGLKVLTNSAIHKPQICSAHPDNVVHVMSSSLDAVSERMLMRGNVRDVTVTIETVRKYFPETWIWSLKTLDSTGKAEVPLTIPDTITEWKAKMFCLSQETGFGLSPTVSLTAFQPFFVDATMPYSVIRAEAFKLKVTVFNYLDQCIRVRITLEKSKEYHAEPTVPEEEAHCIPANERVTVSWAVNPNALGDVKFSVSAEMLQGEGLCGNLIVAQPTTIRKDTIIKSLLVEPEGVKREETINTVMCAKADHPVTEKISLKLPENVVEGSARAYIQVAGDIMGVMIHNLQDLLQMPYGCGEQNMALLAPNLYAMEYLNKTGQLTEEIKAKIIGHLISGYQRQLLYKHMDGSYSAFGPPGEGNTWLTAFTLKFFSKASSLIHIDEKHISDALLWLSARQKSNGCFQNVGQLFNNAMQGGVEDDTTLASFITISLLEANLPPTHPVVRNALFCLDTAFKGTTNVYTKAILAYAFTLAGRDDKRAELLKSLDEVAIKKDGSKHWERIKDTKDEEPLPFFRFHPHAPSAEVEMTGYVLLARLSKHPVSKEDLKESSQIVRWMSKQQNAQGGFRSTQDTCVAFQGMAVYGEATFVKNGASAVTVRCEAKVETQFHVDDGNRLLLQKAKLPHVPGKYIAEVQGNGCVYAQTSLRYNVPCSKGDTPFDLAVWTVPETCNQKSQKSFELHVNVSYTGKRPSSNMAVLELKMPSGYIPVKSTVKALKNLPYVGRADALPNSVNIYLVHVSNATYSFHFTVEQDYVVSHLKPSVINIYDYYENDESSTVEYNAPCMTDPVKVATP
ncbi:alpha-2-macroglobulin-like [Ambystoma mexicanum]|uniref:alpha-2-macroglobulin-like n=1 Tax=Ambystoma mexicanum TaxID=8296 RepID=UPI0037E73F5F